jgi:hypothetical protein
MFSGLLLTFLGVRILKQWYGVFKSSCVLDDGG